MRGRFPDGTWPAALWAVVVLLIVVHQASFWSTARLDTDVMALLPEGERHPAVAKAARRLADGSSRDIVVVVGAADWEGARRAAQATRASLAGFSNLLAPAADASGNASAIIDFYRPWRDRFLTEAQREWLAAATPAQAAAVALMRLSQPVSGPRLTELRADPLGLWVQWWSARAGEFQARPREGFLALEAEGRQWAVLRYRFQGSPLSASGDTLLADALALARQSASATTPGSRVLAAGVPLFAEAVAARASVEINTIGWGSLAAVLLLVWIMFRSLRPIALVGLSLAIGCAAALSVTALAFDRVHLLTLVFGASLVGVAEDYGIHYFAARQGKPQGSGRAVLARLLPGLTLALATSVVAYLALGIAPFPGLRQMALFSATGLSAAFLTVLCWFPLLDRGDLPSTRFADRLAASLPHWPRWRADRVGVILAIGTLLAAAAGLARLEARDDLRQLHGAPPQLVAEQREVAHLLALPSPAQFFLVEGRDAEEVLSREEPLKVRLARLVATGHVSGYRAISDWLPSAARQSENANLAAAAEVAALDAIAAQMGEPAPRPTFAEGTLQIAQWLASPASAASGMQWLGDVGGRSWSIVLLHGVAPSSTAELSQAGRGLAGVVWVDTTAEYSGLMGRYRTLMAWLLAAGYAGVLVTLLTRFGASAWRALLPTALGTALTLATLGWMGFGMQLFVVLALVLLLGMGVDYGIFLLEHPGDGSAWAAVAVAGASTLLSFGLLALSSTPALEAFGLTMLLGESFIWLLTPCFRPGTDGTSRATASRPPRIDSTAACK